MVMLWILLKNRDLGLDLRRNSLGCWPTPLRISGVRFPPKSDMIKSAPEAPALSPTTASVRLVGTNGSTNHSPCMPRLWSCAVLTLLLLSACQEATAPTPDYQAEEAGTVDHAMCLLGFAAIPLREVSTGHHLVQVTINGRSGSFVLDTGANVTVVDASHRQHFGISTSERGLGGVVGGMAGATGARLVSVEGLEIGSVATRQSRIVTADMGQLLSALSQVANRTVYGLIGQDVLKEHRAIVDVARPMLYLIPEDQDPSPVPASQCQGGEVTKSRT